MIQYWRQVWYTRTGGITDPNFPFGFVQVYLLIRIFSRKINYFLQLSTNDKSGNYIGGFPWLRWYQTFNVGYVPNDVVPNVFMAAAMDLRDDDGE